MLRPALLLVSTVSFVALACGSDADFSGAPGGGGSAGSSGQAGSNATAGSNADAGRAGSAGSASQTGGTTANGGTPATGGTSGGTNSTGGTPATGGTSNPTAGTSPGASGSSDGGTSNGVGGDAANAGAAGAQTSGGDGNQAACPNVFGDYEIKSKDGTCGTLNTDAAQSIKGTDVACYAHFVSTPPAGAQGVNGGAALTQDGSFTAAKLYLNDVQRNPCSGTWNAAEKTMTVKCGGQGDLCTVVMKRK
jgi:hypothetical protein